MIRIRIAAMAALLAVFAACASPPAPDIPPRAAPPRDLLVELSDAEAAGDSTAMVSLGRALMADPATDEALRLDLADMMAREGETPEALSAYQAAVDAEMAAAAPDWSRLIGLQARMAEIAADGGLTELATAHAGQAVALVAGHLGPDHPRMAPLLAFARANGLDMARIAMAGGFPSEAEADTALADSVERGRDSSAVLPSGVRPPAPRTVGEEPDFDLVKVFYGTDRAPAPVKKLKVGDQPVLDARTYYSAHRGKLETGTVVVSVPRNRAVGEIPKPSLLRFDVRPDPARHVIVGDMKIHPDMEAFVREVKLELARSERREIFVLIHGYNTKFDAGIERAAQLSVDLEVDGAAVYYSWPSAGSLFGYKADRSQIGDAAVQDLEDFLLILADRTGADRISVVAHSMGNEFLTRALEKMAADRPDETLFNEVVFASPDVDADDFIERVSGIGDGSTAPSRSRSSRHRPAAAYSTRGNRRRTSCPRQSGC